MHGTREERRGVWSMKPCPEEKILFLNKKFYNPVNRKRKNLKVWTSGTGTVTY
jgi:hypothetical protein